MSFTVLMLNTNYPMRKLALIEIHQDIANGVSRGTCIDLDTYMRLMKKYLEDSNVSRKTSVLDSVTINVTYENKEKEMTQKFKAGDKVVRTKPYEFRDDGGFMQVGREYKVVDSYGAELLVEGKGIKYDPVMFELVKPTFKNMKFRVSSSEHSKEIQEALFEMGFCWRSYGCEVRFADSFPPCDYLYTDTNGHLWRIDSEEDYLVSSFKSAQEHTVETTKSYKLIPVVPKPEIITINGKTYDKEAVLKRLAELESI